MHSIASVRSAGGAANYFAKDDYYTAEHASQASEWGGKGAEQLGLTGKVGKADFENLLNGKLPDGTAANPAANRRAGIDLTFSMPKSASVMAYIAGDKRILTAHMAAVKATMSWVEKTMAEARDYSRGPNGEGIRTSNLVYAMFEHDTSRKLDPQGHIHVVVAAITQAAGGKWKALWNGELWKKNSLIGSAYHAAFRDALARLGYETQLTGQHGQFEIRGVPQPILDAFSQRRQDILERAAQLGKGESDTESLREITKRSRDPKLNIENRTALRAHWVERAAALGFDGRQLLAVAIERAGSEPERSIGISGIVRDLVEQVRGAVGAYLRSSDPLTTNGVARAGLTPAELRTEMAVASAIRILGQREAAFRLTDVHRTALNLGLPGVSIGRVERRVTHLVGAGQLIAGESTRLDGTLTHVTTPEHLADERSLLAGIDEGRKSSVPIVAAHQAGDRLQAAAGSRPLNSEQLAAATLALSTRDRIVVIQGVAGAGKTTLIEAMTRVAAEEGHQTVGLAFANKMVAMLRDEANIEARTVSSFVNEHIRGAKAGAGEEFEASRETLAGKILVLDEASLVANEGMNNLVTITNKLGVARLVMIGDHHQLQSIDAGKAFRLIQSDGPDMARLNTSQRQKTPHMQQVAALTRNGDFRQAFDVLGDRVHSEGDRYQERAAAAWLACSPEDRARTAIYASGRTARAALNELVQQGLKEEGSIRSDGVRLETLQQVNTTREELRYAHTYRTGLVVEVVRRMPGVGLASGRYEVIGRDHRDQVILRPGRGRDFKFDPQGIDPVGKADAVQLFEKMNPLLHSGDIIRWTASDKARGLLNSEQAEILAVDSQQVAVRTSDGRVLHMDRQDKMLERLGLAYAINMHQGQGMSTDEGIGVARSSEHNLATQRLMHVMVTRVRNDMQIFTDDGARLLSTIERHRGDKSSALETTGEKRMEPERSVDPARSGPFGPPRPIDFSHQSNALAVQQSAGSFRAAPDGVARLPQRGIERTR
ncbi:MobF family relaxase [Novosphingobium sp. P6W]|uniref:MobF family relaxase n=1 Tax=Novosphingobium sp. P6W TaxID=1609758 RepID=UPI0005C2DAE1|nr:MobF family relaxase [Novosphingobium sp. P6W]AXB80236.1 conjugative relaxase [Novosphingobium sp. P6W]KIS31579.1 ATPase AAA [Novosphingobium sp. P6W]